MGNYLNIIEVLNKYDELHYDEFNKEIWGEITGSLLSSLNLDISSIIKHKNENFDENIITRVVNYNGNYKHSMIIINDYDNLPDKYISVSLNGLYISSILKLWYSDLLITSDYEDKILFLLDTIYKHYNEIKTPLIKLWLNNFYCIKKKLVDEPLHKLIWSVYDDVINSHKPLYIGLDEMYFDMETWNNNRPILDKLKILTNNIEVKISEKIYEE